MTLRVLLAAAIAISMTGIGGAKADALPVGIFADAPPFDFVKDGKYVGFEIDLWDEIATELNIKYELTSMDFGGLIPGLQTGNIEVGLGSFYVTDARREVIDFSDPYFENYDGILIRKDDRSINTDADLAGKSVAAITGAVAADWLRERMPSARAVLFPNLGNAILEFKSGRVDAVVADYPNLAYFIGQDSEASGRVLEAAVGGSKFPVAFAFPKGSALTERVNAEMTKIRSDGRYDALYKKWFGKAP